MGWSGKGAGQLGRGVRLRALESLLGHRAPEIH